MLEVLNNFEIVRYSDVLWTQVLPGILPSPAMSVNGSPDGLSTGDARYYRGSLDGIINRDRLTDAPSGLLDSSWMSSCSVTTDRRSFRLSDVMPVLSDSSPVPTTKPASLPHLLLLTPEPEAKHASDLIQTPGSVFGLSPLPTPRAGGDAPAAVQQNGHVAESPPVNGVTPDREEPASPENHVPNGGLSPSGSTPDFTPSQEAMVKQIVESAIDRWAHRLDSHVRHVHLQLTMMQQASRRDHQAMLQQVFDEVRALRNDIEQMRLGS